MRHPTLLRVLFASFLLCWFARASAQAGGLTVSGCDGVDREELLRLLTIELHTLGADPALTHEVQVSCHEAQVEVRTSLAGEPRAQADLTVQPAERGSLTRLLALRISELLSTPPPRAPVPPAAPAPTGASSRVHDDASAHEPAREPRGTLLVLLQTRRLGTAGTWLLGASVAHVQPLLGPLALASEGGVHLGKADTSLAEVSWRELTFALALLYDVRTRHVDTAAGAGVRAAWAWLSADPLASSHRGRALSAPWLGPYATLRLSFHGRSPFRLVLGGEAGWVTLPIRGLVDRGSTLLGVSGPWVAMHVGAGYGW